MLLLPSSYCNGENHVIKNRLRLTSKANSKVQIIIESHFDLDQELEITIHENDNESVVYLSRTQITELRDRLISVLELPTPKYVYYIILHNGDISTVLSTGVVDKPGIDLLRANTPADCVFSFELMAN
jgi:hypothetical protein